MVADWLQRLLILQDRDLRCDSIQRQLEDIPREIRKDEEQMARLREQVAEKEREVLDLERRRLDLEGEVAVAEEQLVKYKTQQMMVKKNEEYTALEHEIENVKRRISELEDAELQILEEAETRQAELQDLRDRAAQEQAVLQGHIERLHQNHKSFSDELDGAKAAVRECEADMDASVLQQYHYVKSQVKRAPVVVPLESSQCKGCHLKVSGDIESSARRGSELVRCDTCGRILYFDR